jgi:hypothetical protein
MFLINIIESFSWLRFNTFISKKISGLYNATKTLAFASYFCKMRVKIMYWYPDGELIFSEETSHLCLSPLMLRVWILIRVRCTTLWDEVCQWLVTGWWFSPGPPVSSTNKTDRHDITVILLKVALNTIKPNQAILSFIWSLLMLTSSGFCFSLVDDFFFYISDQTPKCGRVKSIWDRLFISFTLYLFVFILLLSPLKT